jgi:hypothetical protein
LKDPDVQVLCGRAHLEGGDVPEGAEEEDDHRLLVPDGRHLHLNAEIIFAILPRNQGCQMVCFQTKNPTLGKFWSVLQWQIFGYI